MFPNVVLRFKFGDINHSSIAQSVERLTVNQNVPGSSPGGGVRRCGGIGRRAGFRFQ
jgi:hypothetical protein